jgi:glycosyltransferase involved in cell wall biosynthesis
MRHLVAFALTPLSHIHVDRRILNQLRVYTSRGWRVTLVIPGAPGATGGPEGELWPGLLVRTFDPRLDNLGFVFSVLGIPPPPGGVDEAALALCREAIDRLPAPKLDQLFAERDDSRSTSAFAVDDSFFGPYAITHRCLDAVRDLQFDALLAADYHGVVAAKILAGQRRVPYLFDSHEFTMGQERKTLTVKKFVRRVEEECIRGAFCFYTISDFFADLFRYEYGLAYRPQYVFNAPDFGDVAAEKDRIARTFALPEGARTLLFHGGLQPVKRNIERMLRIAPGLAAQNIHLVFLGYGALEPAVRAGGPNVWFHPAVDQETMAHWIRSASALAVPYVSVEINQRFCTPNRLFDGLELGTPVIANESLEFVRQILETYGVGHVGPMETDDQMLDTFVAGLRRFETSPIPEESWARVRERFGFAAQREKLETMVAKLEVFLDLRDMDELSRLDAYAETVVTGARSPAPPSLLADNFIRHASGHMDRGRFVDALRALRTAVQIQPDYPGLAETLSALAQAVR